MATDQAANEAKAKAFRAAQLATDGKPEGTRESLARSARMLDTYAPDLYPANEHGQIDFSRAMMESTADEIRAFLAGDVAGDAGFVAGAQACREMMARFVEQGGNPTIAASIRANWSPSWGPDPGKPIV